MNYFSNSKQICLGLEITTIGISLISLLIHSLIYLADSAKAKRFLLLLDVDRELSLPTIYSTLLFCVITYELLLICRINAICLGHPRPCGDLDCDDNVLEVPVFTA